MVGAGAMGSAVGAAYAAGGARAVTTLDGRSERTRRLATAAGLEPLPDLDAVVAAAGIVLSVVPPERSPEVAADIAAAAGRTGSAPLVADLNAVSPATMEAVAVRLGEAHLDVVDGSISGGPPHPAGSTRIYLSGVRAAELAALPAPGIDALAVGERIGTASAIKMCTASVYKGTAGLLAHALLTAHAEGVLEPVLDDLAHGLPHLVERAPRSLASAATKAERYVGEMLEIAATQEAAGLPRGLFDGFAALYEALARSALGAEDPETLDPGLTLEEVLVRLSTEDAGRAAAAGSRRTQ
jgi:3-hydroxyisobutyrate dehydrogenase-like beta-hydroxyacid dehydrogenase